MAEASANDSWLRMGHNGTYAAIETTYGSSAGYSDLYWIDKCGHAPMMEHPKKFNEMVLSWFSKRNLNTSK